MSEAGLVSPATWGKKKLCRFSLQIRHWRKDEFKRPPLFVVLQYLCGIWIWQADGGAEYSPVHVLWVWSCRRRRTDENTKTVSSFVDQLCEVFFKNAQCAGAASQGGNPSPDIDFMIKETANEKKPPWNKTVSSSSRRRTLIVLYASQSRNKAAHCVRPPRITWPVNPGGKQQGKNVCLVVLDETYWIWLE